MDEVGYCSKDFADEPRCDIVNGEWEWRNIYSKQWHSIITKR